ncbi:unnamed protein product [Haemonchus placei]|uniref:Restriction endonuclease subunit S n=1 Tax=Haemonchus placei TaxID=6290 RepID=A0A0N4X4B0_HAEPC|nr:unnamed protein product [Haemonchus placei]
MISRIKILSKITGKLTKSKCIFQVKKFVEEHREANKIEAFSKRIGVIEDRIAWKDRNYEPVVAYFKTHS